MQPAFFVDGQTLATTQYHIDACLWRGDTFIDGATFLVPSKLPEAGLGSYSVHLDHTTGVYHVILQKASLRQYLALENLSNPDFSSHVVEFSAGRMKAVPRAECASASHPRKLQEIGSRVQDYSPIAQPGSVPRQSSDVHLSPAIGPKPHGIDSNGTKSTPAELDSSITGIGRVVGQQAAYEQLSPCIFSISILHLLPWNVVISTSEATDPDTAAQEQEPVLATVEVQHYDSPSSSRRTSGASQGGGVSKSTAPTSPASSTFSVLPFEKSALANLPEVPSAPGKPTATFKALVLEQSKESGSKEPGDSDRSLLGRLSRTLGISIRPSKRWAYDQDGEPVYLEKLAALRNGLAITDNGQVVFAEEASNINARLSFSSPQLPSEPVEVYLPDDFNTMDSAQHGEGPNVLAVEFVSQPGTPLHLLTPGPSSNETQPTAEHVIENEHTPEVPVETDDDAVTNQASKNIYITPNGGKAHGSINSSSFTNIDEMINDLFPEYGDGLDCINVAVDEPRTPPTTNNPPVNPARNVAQSLKGTTMPVPIQLGTPIPNDAIKAINAEFFRLWNEGIASGCWVLGRDEDDVQEIAVVNLAHLYSGLASDFVQVVKDFNKIVAGLWQQGHPRRHLSPGSSDDDLIYDLAACNLEWEYFKAQLKIIPNQSTASELPIKPKKTLEAAPPFSDWYFQSLGGDDRHLEYHSVKTADLDENQDSSYGSRENTDYHHLNFNFDPVNERSYTPAEVSFWAGSTTIDKVLMPCAEHCQVHRVKVVTSQAFKLVDPVIYTGSDIASLTGLTGSALRNAITNDVEVAYEPAGRWNQDIFALEDKKPRIVSADDGDFYEYSENGRYNYLQRPYYIDDRDDEHKLFNVNDFQRSNPQMTRVRIGYEQRFSNLGPFRGVKSPAKRVLDRYP